MSDDERRYSRQEVALVLGKVAHRSAALRSTEGLTKAELRAAVEEVGLDVAQVDVALAELETQDKTDERFAGLQQYVVVQRAVTGKLDTAALEKANKLINRSVGIVGKSELDEHGLSWFGRHVNVSISQERDHVAVVIEERFHNTTRGQLAVGAMGSLMAGAMTLVAAANAGMEGLGFVLGAAIPAVAYTALRKLHAARCAATQRRLEGLGDQIAAALREAAQTRALTDGS